MENALDKALANASLNARMNGDTLHTENLDSIADPILDQFDPNRDGVLTSKTAFPNPRTEFELLQNYQQQMESEYTKVAANNHNNLPLTSIDYKLGEIANAVMYTHKEAELTKLRLDALADMITEISTTITSAAQSMSSAPNLKHRSLDQWDDSQLLNELVERENDLMPFYYELLKRIGSPELQKLVMSSMQGKNASMVTLAQLCSALAPQPIQSQPISGNTVLIPNNPAREKQKQAEALLSQNMLSEEQQKALSDEDYYNWATYMNQLCEASTIMMRFPLTRNHEPIKWNHESVDPHPQYFGQATEEYIRQTNKR